MKRGRWWWAVPAAVLLVAACGGDGNKMESKAAGSSDGAPAAPAAASAADTARSAAKRAGETAAGGQPQAAAAPPTGTTQEQGQPASQPVPALDRKIVYNVSLDLIVRDVQEVFEKISGIAIGGGGLVADSSFRQEGDQRRASITIRVPSTRYNETLSQIRGLAVKVDSERSTGNDVTEEFTDLESRQRNLERTEQQLLVFLGQAKNLTETFQVQDRLNSVRADVEKVRGRINLLNRLSDLATIQVQLRPDTPPAVKNPPKPEPSALAALRRGWEASSVVLGNVAVVALTVAAFSWWLLPFLAVGLWLYRRETRRRGGAVIPAAPTGEGT